MAGQQVGFWQRLGAHIIDSFLLAVIYFFIFLVFGSGLSLEGSFALAYFSNITISLIYFTYFYSTTGQTLGKKIFGLKVVASDGEPLNFALGIIRYIGYYVSLLPVFIGFLMIPFDKEKQGLHDKLAGTYVVKIAKEKDEEAKKEVEDKDKKVTENEDSIREKVSVGG